MTYSFRFLHVSWLWLAFTRTCLFVTLTYLNQHTSSISTWQRLTFGRLVSHSSTAMTWERRLLCSTRLTRTLHESKKLPVHLHQLFNECNTTGKIRKHFHICSSKFSSKTKWDKTQCGTAHMNSKWYTAYQFISTQVLNTTFGRSRNTAYLGLSITPQRSGPESSHKGLVQFPE